MLLMLRLLSLNLLLSAYLFAVSNSEVLDFVKSNIKKNPNIKINSIIVREKIEIKKLKKWEAFFIDMDLEVSGKLIKNSDIVFATNGFISPDIIDMKRGTSLKAIISGSFKSSFYAKGNLLYGSENSKHKVAVFSDPQCSYCIAYMPELLKYAKKYPKTVAVYYYHMPILSIHPASLVLSKASIVAKNKGNKDIFLKMYSNPIKVDLTNGKSDEEVLKLFNKTYGTKISISDISSKKVNALMRKDKLLAQRLLVKGTPTVYIDGKISKNRTSYKNFKKID